VRSDDVVAVWGAGAVGQMAARAAMLLGGERVVCIDRFDYRLAMTERYVGAELLERTGGRAPDVCIEAVGMEAHASGPQGVHDKVKQQLRLETAAPPRCVPRSTTAARAAVSSCSVCSPVRSTSSRSAP
jgi:threonine dehydrogenase-like Zn-dependent dehydrogenase